MSLTVVHMRHGNDEGHSPNGIAIHLSGLTNLGATELDKRVCIRNRTGISQTQIDSCKKRKLGGEKLLSCGWCGVEFPAYRHRRGSAGGF
jgi:hypothetical protein